MTTTALNSQAHKLAKLVAHLRAVEVPPSRRAEVANMLASAEKNLQSVEEHLRAASELETAAVSPR